MTKASFSTEFESFRGQLKSYLFRITTNVEDTEDILQDTYIKALEKIDSFKGKSSLKTWVFAIASNLARDLLRSKKRWPENVTDLAKEAAHSNPEFFKEAMQIKQSSPQGNFEIREHIAFCFTCVSKSLPLEQQVVLLLKEVYAFKVREIALIMDISDAMVKYYLRESRNKMVHIFDHRCSLINKQGVCHQCSELNGIFNPNQNTQEELVKIEMARTVEKKDKQHLFDLRMKIMQQVDPFESDAAELQLHHMAHNHQLMEERSAKD